MQRLHFPVLDVETQEEVLVEAAAELQCGCCASRWHVRRGHLQLPECGCALHAPHCLECGKCGRHCTGHRMIPTMKDIWRENARQKQLQNSVVSSPGRPETDLPLSREGRDYSEFDVEKI